MLNKRNSTKKEETKPKKLRKKKQSLESISSHLKNLGKEKPKGSRRKEIIKVRAEINEVENKTKK